MKRGMGVDVEARVEEGFLLKIAKAIWWSSLLWFGSLLASMVLWRLGFERLCRRGNRGVAAGMDALYNSRVTMGKLPKQEQTAPELHKPVQ